MTEETMKAGLTPGEQEVLSMYSLSFADDHLHEAADRLNGAVKQNVVSQLARVLQTVPESLPTERRLRILYEACAKVCSYDHRENELRYSYVSVLYRNKAVCHGYGEFLCGAAKVLGLEAKELVGGCVGTEDRGHTWVLVKLYGAYYHLDLTWDLGSTQMTYYLKDDAFMRSKKHIWMPSRYPAAPRSYPSPPLNGREFLIKERVARTLRSCRLPGLAKI